MALSSKQYPGGKSMASRWVSGILKFFNASKTHFFSLDPANAKVVFPGALGVGSDVLAADGSTITLGTGGSATQTATIQLADAAGNALSGVRLVEVYMATDAAGATLSVAGASTSVTATTGAILKAHTAKLHLAVVTDAAGKAVLVFNNTGGGGAYTDRVVLSLPGLGVVVSSALNVATS